MMKERDQTGSYPDFMKVYQLLSQSLGEPDGLHESSPLAHCRSSLEILVATMLTQATSDRNALTAWHRFQEVYPRLEMVVEAGADALAEVIRPAGMAVQRSRAILAVLTKVKEDFGEYSLDSLADDPERAWQYLTALPGVGPKTAACTLLFGFNHPFFPVDVHIERIMKRMKWASPKMNPAEIQRMMGEMIPAQLMGGLHILLLNLGRTHCRPTRPDCAHCPLAGECPGV